MTDLTQKQIEDALTDEEYHRWQLCFAQRNPPTNIENWSENLALVSLAEARIENKRLRTGIQMIATDNYRAMIDFADEHGIEHKPAGEYILEMHFETDARYVYPARNTLKRLILEALLESEVQSG